MLSFWPVAEGRKQGGRWSYHQGWVSEPTNYDRRLLRYAIGALRLVSLFGLAVAVLVHLATLFGIDPTVRFKGVWIFQIVLFFLLVPIMIELFRKKNHGSILRSPRWMTYSLYAALGYYALNFYVFLWWSVEHLNSRLTWRMFSAGWLLLFGISAVYYEMRFRSHPQSTLRA